VNGISRGVLIVAVCAAASGAGAAPALVNPGFEAGDTSGWTYYGQYWSSSTYPWFAQIAAVEGSRYAGMMRTTQPSIDTGLWQQVTGAVVGREYSLSAHTLIWWSGQDVRDSVVRLGIDPLGGTDPSAPDIVWSPARATTLEEAHHWVPMDVSVVAGSSTITVFAECCARTEAAGLAACFDGFELVEGPPHCAQPSFSAPTYTPLYRGGLWGLGIVDYDLDGDVDIAVCSEDTASIVLLRNDGRGYLSLATSISAGGVPKRIEIHDFDLDGIDDMAVSIEDGFVHCFLGNGSGFGSYTVTATLALPLGMMAADYNADGWPDLAVCEAGAHYFSVFLGSGDGTFALINTLGTSEHAYKLVYGLLDGDGVPDMGVLSAGGPPLRTYHGFTGHPYFALNDMSSAPVTTRDLELADLDEDGLLDILMNDIGLYYAPRSEVLVLPGTGTWHISTEASIYQLSAAMEPSGMVAADFNADGHADVAVACELGQRVSILPGPGDGTLPSRYAVEVSTNPNAMRVADMNGDGLEDIVAVCNGNDAVAVLRNTCPMTQSPAGWLESGWNLISVPHETEDMSVGVVLERLVPPNVLDNAVFRYDSGSGYSIYPGGFGQFEAGRGYWLYLTAGGRAVAYGGGTQMTKSVQLSSGWTLVGHPQDSPVLLAGCEVNDGSQTKSFDAAVAAGWLEGVIYGYGGGYFTVRTSGGDDAYLRPWRGYWVLANVPGLRLDVPSY